MLAAQSICQERFYSDSHYQKMAGKVSWHLGSLASFAEIGFIVRGLVASLSIEVFFDNIERQSTFKPDKGRCSEWKTIRLQKFLSEELSQRMHSKCIMFMSRLYVRSVLVTIH